MSTSRLFADDSLIYRIICTKEDQIKLQEDLSKLKQWEKDWLMDFNPDKCEVLRMSKKKKSLIQSYKIHGTELQTVDQAKYLGTTISKDLSWNKHVDPVAKKATNSLNILKWNLHGCLSQVKEKCYKSLIRPVMEYSSSVLDPHAQRNINKLEMVQRRTARFVKGDYVRTSSVTSMLADLKRNTLQIRRLQSKTVMFHKIVHQLVAIPTTPHLVPTRSSRGHKMRFLLTQSTVNAHLYSFFPSTMRIWNQLPPEVISSRCSSSDCRSSPPCKRSCF